MEIGKPLSRELIVQTALLMTRTQGLQKVTMRSVSAQLGVSPMALYRHIGDREELNRLVVDLIGSEFTLGCAPGADWREKVRSWAQVQHQRLRDYPGTAAWLMDNGPAGEHAYRILDILADALAGGGFNDAQIARGATLVMSWTFSRIAIEDKADARKLSARPDRANSFVAGLSDFDVEAFPAAKRIGEELFMLQMGEIFHLGIESIIHGLERL